MLAKPAGNRIDVKNDWFNHERYLNSTASLLRTIRPPTSIRYTENRPTPVESNRNLIIDLETEFAAFEESKNSVIDKPKLVPDKPRFFKQKLDLNELKSNKNYNYDMLDLIPKDIS